MVYGRASQKLLRVRGLRCNPSQTQLDFVCYSAVLDVYVLCRHILKFGTLFEQDEACVNMEFSLEIKIAELNIANSAFEYCDVLKYQDGGTNINKNSRWLGRETTSKSQQANIHVLLLECNVFFLGHDSKYRRIF